MNTPTHQPSKSGIEVADILRLYAKPYQLRHRLPTKTQKMIWELCHCRTAAMGGHEARCSACSFKRNEYNSCRNRHCPKCQSLKKAKWLEARKAELLPVDTLHMVFTLPHELNPLMLYNKSVLLNGLFQVVNQTLTAFAKDPRWGLEGQLGFIAILHTWDQRLNLHYHLHCLIPAGALSSDKNRWKHARRSRCRKTGRLKAYLFPVRAVSKVFKGKFLNLLKQAYEDSRLVFPKTHSHLKSKRAFAAFCSECQSKDWVVYSKAPFKGPEYLLEYLGRYVHRVAISNDRINSLKKGRVTFFYKDRSDGFQRKKISLSAEQFIGRFLLHELPLGFRKIRFFGFYANRDRSKNLNRIRYLLHSRRNTKPQKKSGLELICALMGRDITLCPECRRGKLERRILLEPIKKFRDDFRGYPSIFSRSLRE